MAATCSTDSTVWFVVSARSESRSRQKPNAAEHARTSEVTGRARRVLGRVAIGGVGARLVQPIITVKLGQLRNR